MIGYFEWLRYFMNSKNVYKMGAQVLPRALSIRKGAILAILASLFFVIILLIWLFISSLSWVANQFPTTLGSGQQVVDSVLRQGLQLASTAGLATPEIQNRINQLATVAGEQQPAMEEAIGGVVAEQVSGVKRYLSAISPAATSPTRDVSGVDLAPVERYPGFVRASFATNKDKRSVGYMGQANYGSVIDHYVKGFAQLGYGHEIVSATADRELHRFTPNKPSLNTEVITDLIFLRRDGVTVDVLIEQATR